MAIVWGILKFTSFDMITIFVADTAESMVQYNKQAARTLHLNR